MNSVNSTASVSPDRFDFTSCPLSQWDGNPSHCRWCADPIPKHRARFCSPSCTQEWRENHVWPYAKREALRRAHRQCSDAQCDQRRRLEVHHHPPCQGQRQMGCQHHQERLWVLCQDHHDERHLINSTTKRLPSQCPLCGSPTLIGSHYCHAHTWAEDGAA